MKKIIIACLAVAMTGCGIYKPYTRPEIQTDGLYGTAESVDTATFGNMDWREASRRRSTTTPICNRPIGE